MDGRSVRTQVTVAVEAPTDAARKMRSTDPSLIFLDGRGAPCCMGGNAAAGATPGSPYNAVCKKTFARIQAEDPGLAASVLLHEMLHALGLGEDPPTSEEITRQVVRRCGP